MTIGYKRLRHIGFAGGRLVSQLGTVADVKLFFSLIPYVAVANKGLVDTTEWAILQDGLYRRYVGPQDFDRAIRLMSLLKSWCDAQPSDFISWDQFEPSASGLNYPAPTLGEVFSKFFRFFKECVDSARVQKDRSGEDGISSSVRLVISDMGDYIKYEQRRTFSDYLILSKNATPLWATPISDVSTIQVPAK